MYTVSKICYYYNKNLIVISYLQFKDSDRIYVDIPNKSVVLNVGGGYSSLKEYFNQHDACRKTGIIKTL